MAKAARDRVADVKPYVQRAIQDEELRENLRSAFDTARDVYAELIGKRGMTGVATKVASDKEIQDQLRSAIDDLRAAANRIQGNATHKSRNGTLLLAGIALGILFNPHDRPGDPALAEEQDLRRGGGVRVRRGFRRKLFVERFDRSVQTAGDTG